MLIYIIPDYAAIGILLFVLVIGTYLINKIEELKIYQHKAEIAQQNYQALERNLLNSTYDFALLFIKNYCSLVTEGRELDGSRFIRGWSKCNVGGSVLNTWLFRREIGPLHYSAPREACTHLYIVCHAPQIEAVLRTEIGKGLDLTDDSWYNPTRKMEYFFDDADDRYGFEVTLSERGPTQQLTSAQRYWAKKLAVALNETFVGKLKNIASEDLLL